MGWSRADETAAGELIDFCGVQLKKHSRGHSPCIESSLELDNATLRGVDVQGTLRKLHS